MSESKRIQGSMQVFVKGTVVWVGYDTTHPVGTPTTSGKSRIVARTLGLVPVEVGGRKYGVMGGLYEPVAKQDAYASALTRAQHELMVRGMPAEAAAEAAKAIVPAPKVKEDMAATAAQATAAAKSLITDGIAHAVAFTVPRRGKGKTARAGDVILLSSLPDAV